VDKKLSHKGNGIGCADAFRLSIFSAEPRSG
jgi:hypothetical protein